MKKFSEAVLSPHKHMSKKASPYHAHSQGLVYTPKGKEEVRPIDTADAGYGGEAVADGEGGEANAGRASKKAVAPMKMQTLVKKTNEGFDSSPSDIAKMLVAKHGKNVTKDHIKALEQDRDSHSGLDHDEIMQHVKKLQEETERERLMKLRSFAFKNREKGLGKAMIEEEQIDELKKSTLASYAKKATDDVSYHSFTAGTMSAKNPERLAQDKKAMKRQTGVIKAIDRLAKEEVELDERNMENKAKKDNVVRQVGTHAFIKHGTDAGSPKMTGRKVMKDPKMKSSKIADMYRKLPSMREENEWNGPAEENDMAMTQLHFIVYAAEEIMHAIRVGTDMEEWYQNKLSKVHSDMESLHSYMEGTKRHHGSLGDPVAEGKMKDIATDKAEDDRLAAHAAEVLGGPVKPKSSAIGGPGKPKSARNLAKRLATKAMKAGHSVSEEKKSKVPRIGEMEKALEEEQIDELMGPDLRSQQAKENDAHFKKQPPRMQTAIRYHLKNRKSYKDAVTAAEKDVATMHEEVWDKPMPDSKKQGSLSPEQKAKAKARAERAGRSYPNMIDNMWASKQ